MSAVPAWVALAWRLPAGSSTPRVTTWRNLHRLGTARLTPRAALLPFREDLQEQLDWIAQDIEAQGGEAWVLPVIGLSESEERTVRDRMTADRDEEYRALEKDALACIARRSYRSTTRRGIWTTPKAPSPSTICRSRVTKATR
jgi:hypothetical protein